mgnify:CR=1 FL=1
MAEGYLSRAAGKVDTAIEKVKDAPRRLGTKARGVKGMVKSGVERSAGKATLFFAKPLAVIGIGYLIWIKTAPQRERIVEPFGEG